MRRAGILLSLWLVAGCWNTPPGDVARPAAVAAHPEWGTSYETALEAAGKRGVLVLADFTGSDWCPWCIKLREEVFDTPEFRAWSAKNAVLLEVDFPETHPLPADVEKQNKRLEAKYSVEGFPTVLFLDARGQKKGELGYIAGGPTVWTKKAQEIIDGRAP